MTVSTNPEKLLIVDDMPINIKVLVQTLRSQYDITVATDGLTALELTTSEKPDLILLDIVMPEMDGYEICRKLKSNEQTRDIPVIFITAKDEDADETQGLELGAVDYITKPFSTSIVLARVKNHLRLKKAMEEISNYNKALLEADELKENVNRIMRHDLKSPLNAIIGFSSLLLEKGWDGDDKESLEFISNSAYTLLGLIDQSLDLYKMEQGIYQLRPISVNLSETIRKIIKTHARDVALKRLTIQLVPDSATMTTQNPAIILGEELLCYSLLANLMKNAVEAAPKSSLILVSLKSETTALEVAIHNQGEIPPSIRDRFFDKYVTFGKSFGTGLGTYSARLMAQTQNGSIRFESSEATGTTVTVRLPVPG
ncbi:MAG: hybrid sensor histidine kinase/response regulator [Magnetococcales bacterium]|nr:hybrid sensor histidine kinase/response regulator [Magnetococcales bacterium]HIJ83507.1 response regulator [Magnetococcales bacterium]